MNACSTFHKSKSLLSLDINFLSLFTNINSKYHNKDVFFKISDRWRSFDISVTPHYPLLVDFGLFVNWG